MRLFTAITFSPETEECIYGISESLMNSFPRMRIEKKENLHLTLSFIGEVEPSSLSDVIEALDSVSFSPFVININDISFFSRKGGRIYYIGVERNEALLSLQRSQEKALLDLGLKLEERKYRPHVTLSRRAYDDIPAASTNRIAEEVSSFSLMLSERGERGMIYTTIFTKKAEE